MKENIFNRDCAGVAVSSLCLLHCVALPLTPVLFPALLPFLSDNIFEHLLQTQGLKSASLSFLEYVFWVMAFLATTFSLKKLLRPHTCNAHHPKSFIISPYKNAQEKNISTDFYKKGALGFSFLGWLWFLVVVLNHLPHLWTVLTSAFLVASHVCALIYSIKTSKINQQSPPRLAPSTTNV